MNKVNHAKTYIYKIIILGEETEIILPVKLSKQDFTNEMQLFVKEFKPIQDKDFDFLKDMFKI